MTFQTIRSKFIEQQTNLDDIHQWRSFILSIILQVAAVLGFIVAVPSSLFAVFEGRASIAVVDVFTLAWIVILWRRRSLSFQVRAWNFCALIYLLGLSLLLTVGAASQIYLMGFPVMAAVLLGRRPALFALALNAVTLMGVGYFANADLQIAGFESQPFMRWTVITINFVFIDALITISTVMLLDGLKKSLEKSREGEELYRATFESAPIGVARLNMDGRWLQVNHQIVEPGL